MTSAVVIPPIPVPPSQWSVTTIVTYLGGLALFILGLLTASGVTVPSGISTEVQVVVGSLTTISGALVPLIALLSKHSVQKAAIKVGVPVAEAVRL